jgi:hypothetical protein
MEAALICFLLGERAISVLLGQLRFRPVQSGSLLHLTEALPAGSCLTETALENSGDWGQGDGSIEQVSAPTFHRRKHGHEEFCHSIKTRHAGDGSSGSLWLHLRS